VAEASLIGVLECVLGPLWVWLAIGERPGLFALIGGVVILSALVAHTVADLAQSRRQSLEAVT
jgi:drug/metabolite transporter (DMT)-like permease